MARKQLGRKMGVEMATSYRLEIGGFTLTSDQAGVKVRVLDGAANAASIAAQGKTITIRLSAAQVQGNGITGTDLKALFDAAPAAVTALVTPAGAGTAPKVDEGEFPFGGQEYEYLATINAKTFTVNNVRIDVTTASPEEADIFFRETLPGMKSFDLTCDGIGDDSDTLGKLEEIAFSADPVMRIRLTDPGQAVYTGRFALSTYVKTGELEGNVTFSATFESTEDTVRTAL